MLHDLACLQSHEHQQYFGYKQLHGVEWSLNLQQASDPQHIHDHLQTLNCKYVDSNPHLHTGCLTFSKVIRGQHLLEVVTLCGEDELVCLYLLPSNLYSNQMLVTR
jgi:hypothetical protein